MPGSTKNHEEEKQWNFRRCKEYGLGNLRDPVLMTIHLYSKVRIGFRGRCWETIQYKITTKIRRLKGSNAVSLQLPWPTTAAAQHPTHPKDNTSHFHPLLEMATNKNDIISQLSDCSSSWHAKKVAACRVYSVRTYFVHNTQETDFFSFSCGTLFSRTLGTSTTGS